MASRGPMKHRPGAFWPKIDFLSPKLLKNVKMVKMVQFSIFDLQNDLFLQFLTFRPWGGRLRKRVKNLVEFEDFWDPKTLQTHFGLIFTKNHHFGVLALEDAKI